MENRYPERIQKIIARRMAGAAICAEDEAALQEWISLTPANAEAYRRITDGESRRWFDDFYSHHDPEATVAGVRRRIARRTRRRLAARIGAAAAVVAVGAFALFYSESLRRVGPDTPVDFSERYMAVMSLDDGRRIGLGDSEKETEWQERLAAEQTAQHGANEPGTTVKVEVPHGGEYKLRLGDGTLVWLNSETVIEYPRDFDAEHRTVRLSGEAYFEVAPDAARPFTVDLPGEANVTVLGTSFNISAYESDPTMAATLVEGRVKVTAEGAVAELLPGEQAVIGREVGGITVSEVNARNYISWTEGMFEFRNMPLTEICTRLARWYDVRFEFEGTGGEERFTGGAWKYQPLRTFLDDIESVTDVEFDYRGDRITVKNKR